MKEVWHLAGQDIQNPDARGWVLLPDLALLMGKVSSNERRAKSGLGSPGWGVGPPVPSQLIFHPGCCILGVDWEGTGGGFGQLCSQSKFSF